MNPREPEISPLLVQLTSSFALIVYDYRQPKKQYPFIPVGPAPAANDGKVYSHSHSCSDRIELIFFVRTFDLVSECNTFCACAVAGGAEPSPEQ